MAAAHLRSSNSSAESQALVRQAELNIETSEQRLEFLEGQLEKKRRRRMGVPEAEGKKWTNQLGTSHINFLPSKADQGMFVFSLQDRTLTCTSVTLRPSVVRPLRPHSGRDASVGPAHLTHAQQA